MCKYIKHYIGCLLKTITTIKLKEKECFANKTKNKELCLNFLLLYEFKNEQDLRIIFDLTFLFKKEKLTTNCL